MLPLYLASGVSVFADETLVKPLRWTWNHTGGLRSWIGKRLVDALEPSPRVGRLQTLVSHMIGSRAHHLAAQWSRPSWLAPFWTVLDASTIAVYAISAPSAVATAYLEDRAYSLIHQTIVEPGGWIGHRIGAIASSAWSGAKGLAHDVGGFLGL